jgi:hypothetical protein
MAALKLPKNTTHNLKEYYERKTSKTVKNGMSSNERIKM